MRILPMLLMSLWLPLHAASAIFDHIDAVERILIDQFGKPNPFLSAPYTLRIALDVYDSIDETESVSAQKDEKAIEEMIYAIDAEMVFFIDEWKHHGNTNEYLERIIQRSSILGQYINTHYASLIEESRFFQSSLQTRNTRELATLLLLPGVISKGLWVVGGLITALFIWLKTKPAKIKTREITQLENHYQTEIRKTLKPAVKKAAGRSAGWLTAPRSMKKAIELLNNKIGGRDVIAKDTVPPLRRLINAFGRLNPFSVRSRNN